MRHPLERPILGKAETALLLLIVFFSATWLGIVLALGVRALLEGRP